MKRQRNWHPYVAVTLAIVSSPALGETLRVATDGSQPFNEIQAAIHSAASGDTVLVSPGTYFEDVTLAGRLVVLISRDGPEVTTINASLDDSAAVSLVRFEPVGTTISGFTITGGNVPQGTGGGINCFSGSALIIDNTIQGNSARYAGGIHAGINTLRVGPIPQISIEGNRIFENVSAYNGGGVDIDIAHCVVRNNRIERNTATYDGGGVEVRNTAGSTLIVDNNIADNKAGDKGGGLRAFCIAGLGCLGVTIRGNVVARNEASGSEIGETGAGGGVAIEGDGILLENNTIVDNRGMSEQPCSGGGVLILYTSVGATTIRSNIIAFNSDCGVACRGSRATMDKNLLWGNSGGDVELGYAGCGEVTEVGIVIADPLICDLDSHDYSLSSASPALGSLGVIGAIEMPGCNRVPVVPSTWSRLKSRLLQR